jgi:hypothetical protein
MSDHPEYSMTSIERLKRQRALAKQELDENDRAERERVATGNRKRGIAQPVVGERLLVTARKPKWPPPIESAFGFRRTRDPRPPRRRRAGLAFDDHAHAVEVVDGDDAAVAARQVAGESVVTIDGAEQILADELLVVTRQRPDTSVAALEAELAALELELCSLPVPDDAEVAP